MGTACLVFREADRGRKEDYERELAEMQRRIAQRPLLLEKESQANAKRKAERKYTQILRDAGVDENLVSKLITREGKIIDANEDSEDGEINLEETADVNESLKYSQQQQNGAVPYQDYLSEESEDNTESEGSRR